MTKYYLHGNVPLYYGSGILLTKIAKIIYSNLCINKKWNQEHRRIQSCPYLICFSTFVCLSRWMSITSIEIFSILNMKWGRSTEFTSVMLIIWWNKKWHSSHFLKNYLKITFLTKIISCKLSSIELLFDTNLY